MQTHLEKSIVRLLAVKFATECGEVLSLYRAKRDGWIKMPEEFEQVRKNSGLGDLYVIAYEEESRILSCLIKALFPGEAIEEFRQFNDELVSLPEETKIDYIDSYFNNIICDESSNPFKDIFHATKEESEAAKNGLMHCPRMRNKNYSFLLN